MIAKQELQEVGSALDREGVRWWLQGGYMLGLVRNGHYLDWDHDIDLCSSSSWRDVDRALNEFDTLYVKEKNRFIVFKPIQIGIELVELNGEYHKRNLLIHNKLGRVLDYLIWSLRIDKAEHKRGRVNDNVTTSLIHFNGCIPTILRNRLETCLCNVYKKLGGSWSEVVVPTRFYKRLEEFNCDGIRVKVPYPKEDFLEWKYGNWRIEKKVYKSHEDDKGVIK
jgi:hypothetical protein